MVFLILESLGSTEFAFILVMALMFFGPRKLPQLSRTMGKHLASFRRASEDFKSTWEREVTLEEMRLTQADLEPGQSRANSILDPDNQPLQPSLPTIEPVDSARVVPRQSPTSDPDNPVPTIKAVDRSEPQSKRDWL